MKKDFLKILMVSLFVLSLGRVVSAQDYSINLGEGRAVGDLDEERPLTQEEFAVELVKLMRIEDLLPPAALPRDCVNLLESIGVAPHRGWNNKAFLGREEYLVIVGKAQGKEGIVHRSAAAVEQKNVQIINKKWQQAYDRTGRWVSLSELLKDPMYFPSGSPKSPYGIKYRDRDGDHKVDPVFLPANSLMELRGFISTE